MGGVGIIALVLVIVAVVLVARMCGSFASGLGGGADVAKVPDVTGMGEQDAQSALQRAGLAPKTVEREFNEEVPAGSVFNQNPPAGKKVRQGTIVSLYISLGQGRFEVPDLTGQDVTEATRALMDAGFTLGVITKVYRPELPAGRVINQEPVPGRVFPASTSIDLTVADVENLPAIDMPALAGLPLASAEQQLVSSNLQLSQVTYSPTDDSPTGVVLTQSPGAASPVELGSKVELSVAMPTADAAERNKTVNLHIPVPPGPEKQRVRVKVFDALGSDVYFDEELGPGGVVDKRVNIEGKATIMIFINDMSAPYRKEIIPYTEPVALPAEGQPAGGGY